MKGMTVIVKTITKMIAGLIFMFGVNTVLYGHLTPGGGFAGGIMLACSYILITLSFGKEEVLKHLSRTVAFRLDSISALMFLLIAWFGTIAGYFFSNFIQQICPGTGLKLLSAGTIPLSNIAIGLKVGSAIFMVFIILSVAKVRLENRRK